MQKLKHTNISNLFRYEASGIYYAIVKINGKQKRKNLKTTDKEIARRKMEDFRRQVGRLTSADARCLPFAEYNDQGELIGGLVKRWWVHACPQVETQDTGTRNLYHQISVSPFPGADREGNHPPPH